MTSSLSTCTRKSHIIYFLYTCTTDLTIAYVLCKYYQTTSCHKFENQIHDCAHNALIRINFDIAGLSKIKN